MSDVLIKNMKMPKSCDTCIFLFLGSGGRCWFSGCRCRKTKRPNNCPLVEYPTDFIKKLVQDLERLSAKVHELSQDYMSNDLYDVHTDIVECIESMRIAFGKEVSE